MDDLISRQALLAAYDERHKGPPGGARELIEDVPSVPAVPLDKLCEWLGKVAMVRCNECSQNLCAGDACSSSDHWGKEIKKWMEGLDAEVH